jgi:hypothetical protein
MASIAPIGRGAEPQVFTTVTRVAAWPAFNQLVALLRTSRSTLSIAHLCVFNKTPPSAQTASAARRDHRRRVRMIRMALKGIPRSGTGQGCVHVGASTSKPIRLIFINSPYGASRYSAF